MRIDPNPFRKPDTKPAPLQARQPLITLSEAERFDAMTPFMNEALRTAEGLGWELEPAIDDDLFAEQMATDERVALPSSRKA